LGELGVPINFSVFADDYIPKKLLFREKEYAQLVNELKLASVGFPHSRLMIWGAPGSGKTITVKKAFMDSGMKHYYVISKKTDYLTFLELCRAILGRVMAGRGMQPWGEIEPKLSDSYVILDEADRFIGKGNEELLYCLSRAPRVGIVLITNKGDLMHMIKDPRVQSSLMPTKIWFRAYTADEVKSILTTRLSEALPDWQSVVDEGIINYIVAKTIQRGSDVRYAITLLRESIKLALMEDVFRVLDRHVSEAEDRMNINEAEKMVDELTDPQRLLLLCVRHRHTPSSIYSLYNKIAPHVGLSSLSDRRLRMLMSELELFGLVKTFRKGSVYYQVIMSDWYDHARVEELLRSRFEKRLDEYL
jgi:cell division control protein 6